MLCVVCTNSFATVVFVFVSTCEAVAQGDSMSETQRLGTGYGSWMASILFGVFLVTRDEFRSPLVTGGLLGCLGLLGSVVDVLRRQLFLALVPGVQVLEARAEDGSFVG